MEKVTITTTIQTSGIIDTILEMDEDFFGSAYIFLKLSVCCRKTQIMMHENVLIRLLHLYVTLCLILPNYV